MEILKTLAKTQHQHQAAEGTKTTWFGEHQEDELGTLTGSWWSMTIISKG
jgi:hypothetical protein